MDQMDTVEAAGRLPLHGVRCAMRADGSMWTMGNWRSIPVLLRAAMDADLAVSSMLVWDKDWIGPAGPQGLRSQHEICLVMPGGAAWKQPDRSQGDVLRIRASSSKPSGHPAEKPPALMARLLELAAPPTEGAILDPFAGSGVTGVIAKAAGRRCILIEAEERWCEVSAKRLSQDVIDLSGWST